MSWNMCGWSRGSPEEDETDYREGIIGISGLFYGRPNGFEIGAAKGRVLQNPICQNHDVDTYWLMGLEMDIAA